MNRQKSHTIESQFVQQLRDGEIDWVISVPDGYLATLIKAITPQSNIRHIQVSREEEAFGVASGLALANQRVCVMMQNVGWLNSLGAYSTLCERYGFAMLVILSHRGNVFDQNSYDIAKYQLSNAVLNAYPFLQHSWYALQTETHLLRNLINQAWTAQQPVILKLDLPPTKPLMRNNNATT